MLDIKKIFSMYIGICTLNSEEGFSGENEEKREPKYMGYLVKCEDGIYRPEFLVRKRFLLGVKEKIISLISGVGK